MKTIEYSFNSRISFPPFKNCLINAVIWILIQNGSERNGKIEELHSLDDFKHKIRSYSLKFKSNVIIKITKVNGKGVDDVY